MKRSILLCLTVMFLWPHVSFAQKELQVDKAQVIQVQPVPKCKGYQFRNQVIYGPNDPGIEAVLTKMNSINFYKMQDIGYDQAYMTAAFNDLANFLALVNQFYAQNPAGTKLTIKFPCIPKNVVRQPPAPFKTDEKRTSIFFADPAFIVLLAIPEPAPEPSFDIFGQGDGPLFPDPPSDWNLYGDFADECWTGGLSHSSGFGLELGGCAGDDGFGLGVNSISLTMDVITVWDNLFGD